MRWFLFSLTIGHKLIYKICADIITLINLIFIRLVKIVTTINLDNT